MSEYENMTLEELEKLKEERKKAELVAQFEADDKAKLEAEQKAHDEQVAFEAIETYKNSLDKPDQTIVQPLDTQKNTETNPHFDFLKEYTGGEIHSYEETVSGKTFNFTNF